MILAFGARNFLSFKEGIDISLRLNKNCPEYISKGLDFASTLCVKGNNASGKSNILQILDFFSYYCINSFGELKPKDKIPVKSFYFNEDPTELYLEYFIAKKSYRYELVVTSEKVISETLFDITAKQSQKVLFIRKNNNVTVPSKNFFSLKKVRLRDNASIISTAFQYELESIIPHYDKIRSIQVDRLMFTPLEEKITFISEALEDDDFVFNFVKTQIMDFDTGIIDIELREKEQEKGEFFPIFFHETEDGKVTPLFFHEESKGTQNLFINLGWYCISLIGGLTLVMDEFDLHLHPHISHALVEMFDDPAINVNNSQFIFTTHDIPLMDKMGKYRTFIVNKEYNESYGYRLDELPTKELELKNDRPISPYYNTGKLGGVPNL
ncbi:ATP-binding protein [Lentisphaera marina]|uniref:AAA family ATPase n=1 Tax=Lentisphaera marina TaxID=1111041 RepID=UPI0023653560|nr:ATP-binding protein [Lentisphaera marina]MDD7987275.1 ATP-binding protein [Lentisphaera marina]